MIYYTDGSPIKIGDKVKMYTEGIIGEVVEIIISDELRKAWNVEENGILFKTEKYGLIFECLTSFQSEPFSLLSRGF